MKSLFKSAGKRCLALLLVVALAVPNTGLQIFASSKEKEVQYSQEVINEMEKLCSDEEDPIEVLDTLQKHGLVDETGMPIVGSTFDVDGIKMTEEELIEEAKKHETGTVFIDGIELEWVNIRYLLYYKYALQEVAEYADLNYTIDESNEEAYIESLSSLKAQLMSGGIEVTQNSAQTTYGAGINHQARVIVTADKTSIVESGSRETITVSVTLSSKQEKPVSFVYRTLSGSASAGGEGMVTLPAGQTQTKFQVTYFGNADKRNGKRVFYIQCYDIKNALFANGESGGRSITIPIQITKNDTYDFSEYVTRDGKKELDRTSKVKNGWWTRTAYFDSDAWALYNSKIKDYISDVSDEYKFIDTIETTITYDDVKEYVSDGKEYVYTLTYRSDPKTYPDNEDFRTIWGATYAASLTGWDTDKTNRTLKTFYHVFDHDDWGDDRESYLNRVDVYELGPQIINSSAKWHCTTEIGPISHDINFDGGVSMTMEIKEYHPYVNLVGLSIPSGTFYSGQSVPITATFDYEMNIDEKIKLKLADNSVLTPVETGTKGKECTFLYRVPIMPSGSIPGITELVLDKAKTCSDDIAIIPNQADTKFNLVRLEQEYPGRVMRSNENCKLRNYKDASFTDISCEIDDNLAGKQWVTEVIKIDQAENGAFRSWIQSNCSEIYGLDLADKKYLRNGADLQKGLEETSYKAYADTTKYMISEYVKSMYLSLDGGVTRIPLYVVAQLGDTTETNEVPVALVAQYRPELNLAQTDRQDVLEIFIDPDIGSTTDYMKEDKDAELLISQTCRSVITPTTYPVKPVCFAYPGAATIDYSTDNPFLSNWSNLVDDESKLVTYHLEYDEDITHAVTTGKENPTYYDNTEEKIEHTSTNVKEDEEDKKIVLSETSRENPEEAIATEVYEMDDAFITNAFRVQGDQLTVTAKLADDFTFLGTDDLIWVSSDETIATVQYPSEFIGDNAENYGADRTAKVFITPTGKTGCVYFTLYALNGDIEGFAPVELCRTVTLLCEEGKDSFLKIPSVNGEQPVLLGVQNRSLDVCFSSNLTHRNADEANAFSLLGDYKIEEYPTEFKLEVFMANSVGNPTGDAIYTGTEISTEKKTIGKMTIPANVLAKASTSEKANYVVRISAECLNSETTVDGIKEKISTLSTYAGICVLPEAPKISLGKLESYSILDTQPLEVSYELDTHGNTPYATSLSIIDSNGDEVYSEALQEGNHETSWSPEAVTGQLKKVYVVKASVQARSGDIPSTDSFVIQVYNHNALDILVDAVGGKNEAGKTDINQVTLDNHSKIKELLSEDKKRITLDGEEISLASLMQDINLSSILSINYGDYVWGQISDQIQWDVTDSDSEEDTATTLNYEQGGAYSNIKSYSYVSYSPSANFMAVGLEDGKTVIKATQVRTGMSSEIEITSKPLKNQFFLFQFSPAVKTKVEYENGDGEACVVESNENGELALYEESGIAGDVHLYSQYEEESYIGTIPNCNLVSGEQDISKKQTYPINNYMLRSVSKVEIYISDENGKPYANKSVWLRGGVYKNYDYCYAAKMGPAKNQLKDGKQDVEYKTDGSGIVKVYFDTSQFYTLEEEYTSDRHITSSDKIAYSFEVKLTADEEVEKAEKVYEPQLIHVHTSVDGLSLTTSCSTTMQARVATTGVNSSVINSQQIFQYERNSGKLSDVVDVYGNTESVGISYQYPKTILDTETLIWGVKLDTKPLTYTDKQGNVIHYGECAVEIDEKEYQSYYTDDLGIKPVNQVSKTVYYPFVDMPVVESTWTMEKEEMDKWVVKDEIKPLNVVVYNRNAEQKKIDNSFTCTNSTDKDPSEEEGVQDTVKEAAKSWNTELEFAPISGSTLSLDKLVGEEGSKLAEGTSEDGLPVKVTISLTSDPEIFYALVIIGNPNDGFVEDYVTDGLDGDDGTSFEYSDEEDDDEYPSKEAVEKYRKEKKEKEEEEKKKKENKDSKSDKSSTDKKTDDKSGDKSKKDEEEEKTELFEHKWEKDNMSLTLTYGGHFMLLLKRTDDIWTSQFVNGGIGAGLAFEYTPLNHQFFVGPIPATASIKLTASGELDLAIVSGSGDKGAGTNFLTYLDMKLGLEGFAGIGCDYGAFAIKLGIVGAIEVGNAFKYLHVSGGQNTSSQDLVGYNFSVGGSVGLQFKLKLLFICYETTFCSLSYTVGYETDDWGTIDDIWNATRGVDPEEDEEEEGAKAEATRLTDDTVLYTLSESALESRSYLAAYDRGWEGGSITAPTADGDYHLNSIQSNAYTFAEPMYNDDGSIIAYLSDSDSTELEDTLASYAVLDGTTYVNQHGIDPVTYTTDELDNETAAAGADGKLDPIYNSEGVVINQYRTTSRTGYGDSSVRIAGNKDFSVSTWVRAKSELTKEAGEEASYQDVTSMLTGSEVYASVWTGSEWSSIQLTDNGSADLDPVVAVGEKYAVVAWRNVAASDSNNPLDFDVCDSVYARVYDREKKTWGERVGLYNGQTGSVTSIQAEILNNGTALVGYVIKTGDDNTVFTDTEIMYTMLQPNGTVGESVRVTNDNNLDMNLQLEKINWNGGEHVILGWYNEKVVQEDIEKVEKDIRLIAVGENGLPSSDFIESIRQAGMQEVTNNFKFSAPTKNPTLSDLSIIWVDKHKNENPKVVPENQQVVQDIYTLSAVRFYEDGNEVLTTVPMVIAQMGDGDVIDTFNAYSEEDALYTVLQNTHYEIDLNDPSTYTEEEITQVVDVDENGNAVTKKEKVYIPQGKTNMYNVVSKYDRCKIQVEEPEVDKDEVIRGFMMPFSFTVKNTGIQKIDKVTITLDQEATDFDVSIRPGETTTQTVYYKVPADKIQDIEYSVVAYNGELTSNEKETSGVIKLNLPEVALDEMKLVGEENKTRTIQFALSNTTTIPLENSEKKVVVELYDQNPDTAITEEDQETKPIKTITISDSQSLALIDAGAYTCEFKLSEAQMEQILESQFTEEQLEESNYEIPKEEILLYGKVWITDENGEQLAEENEYDNQGNVSIQSLVSKYQSNTSFTTRIEQVEDGVDVVTTIKNNSFAEKTNGNLIAVLKNQNGKVISVVKQTYDASKEDKGIICIDEEATEEIGIHFTEEDLLEGHTLGEAVSGYATYGDIEDSTRTARLASFYLPGQPISLDIFAENTNRTQSKVTKKKVMIEENGKEVGENLEVHTTNYYATQPLNVTQLHSVLTAIPENSDDTVVLKVNNKNSDSVQGTQVMNTDLSTISNSISATVTGKMYKQMEVKRRTQEKDSSGKTKVTIVKERYELNENGNPIDSNGDKVDLTEEDILGYEIIYVQNVCNYYVTLNAQPDGTIPVAENVGNGSVETTDSNKTPIFLKAIASKTSNKLTWNKVSEADGYLVYGEKCNTSKTTYKMKLLKTIKNNSTVTYTHSGLKENQWYKYYVVAYKVKDGKKVKIGTSNIARSFPVSSTAKYANATKVTVKKSSLSVKQNKTVQVEATVVFPNGKKQKKQGLDIRYISSNNTIATVSSSGKVKGKKKGTCYVYAIAPNGVYKKVKITVE